MLEHPAVKTRCWVGLSQLNVEAILRFLAAGRSAGKSTLHQTKQIIFPFTDQLKEVYLMLGPELTNFGRPNIFQYGFLLMFSL